MLLSEILMIYISCNYNIQKQQEADFEISILLFFIALSIINTRPKQVFLYLQLVC